MEPNLLEKTARFWDSNPCDGQSNFAERERFRFAKEPWLRDKIIKIAQRHRQILEIGCGQGTDALTFCKLLPEGAEYLGVDYSEQSIAAARQAHQETKDALRVQPKFQRENAEALSFASESIEAVYSMGVLHHTPDTRQALREVHRVLKKGGKAYIILYRTYSPKLLAAHLARSVQSGIDVVLKTDRSLLQIAKRFKMPKFLGTAIEEGFGVPILHSYTKNQILDLFSEFKNLKISQHGSGLPPGTLASWLEPNGNNLLGYFWYVECEKL